MKKIKNIIIVFALIIYIPLILNPECGVSSNYASPYEGKWKFSFSYDNGTTFASTMINVQDGRFCSKIKVSDTGEEFYVSGNIDYNDEVMGLFSDSCEYYLSTDMLAGSFSELMGAVSGSGSFSYTERNPVYKGTWLAKRN